jgi:hypothetical protein
VQHLALRDEVGDSGGGLLDRGFAVDAVLVVQVERPLIASPTISSLRNGP